MESLPPPNRRRRRRRRLRLRLRLRLDLRSRSTVPTSRTTHHVNMFSLLIILLLTSSRHFTSAARHGSDLDLALLTDLLPPISSQCITTGRSSSGTSSFNFAYTPPPPTSYSTSAFSAHAMKHERTNLFQATIAHSNPNTNRTWSLRIGSGGNVYSHVGPYGETIPPQLWEFSPFVDEVFQSVPTDLTRNQPGKDDDAGAHGHFFVHQAGSYKQDSPYTDDVGGETGGDGPMYGPTIAHHCTDADDPQNTNGILVCTFASWGQHGWIPTYYTSPIIFITRYADCGEGVFEATYGVHNMMEPTSLEKKKVRKVREIASAEEEEAAAAAASPAEAAPTSPVGVHDGKAKRQVLESIEIGVAGPNGSDGGGNERRKLDGQQQAATSTSNTEPSPNSNNISNSRRLESSEPPIQIGLVSIPWGGVRTSTLRDVVFSRPDGSLIDDPPPRPQQFGSSKENLRSVKDTGGFTIFAQDLPHPDNTPEFSLPCRFTDGTTVDFCTDDQIASTPGAVRPQFVVARDNPATLDPSFSREWRDVIRLELESTTAFHQGCTECQLTLTNPLTAKTFDIKSVKHWILGGRFFVFSPQRNGAEELAKLNAIFQQGDTIEITLADRGLRPEDNLAWTHVHGRDEEYGDPGANYFTGPTRIRYGLSHDVRDYTVWTCNAWVRINPGDTYVSRQYYITDRYSDSAARARQLVPETMQDMIEPGDKLGRTVVLYKDDDGTTFGAAVGSDSSPASCTKGQEVCAGSTVPTGNTHALFQITCADETFIGMDRYHFSPPSSEAEGKPLRSYVCDGQPITKRPEWKLLGYFVEGECDDALAGAVYDESYCSNGEVEAVVEEVPRTQAAASDEGRTSPQPIGQIILQDNIPPSSDQCMPSAAEGATYSTFDYTPSSATASPFEEQAFLAMMNHTNPSDSTKSWQMNIGKGGNIMSFRGVYGEALPSYDLKNPHTARVWENAVRNGDEKHVVSQAGSQGGDVGFTDTAQGQPFYSPTVASYCKDDVCSFASWGQEAAVPTNYGSDAILFSRYTNCGEGVIEETTVVHNTADPADADAPSLSHMYIPHREIDAATLRNVVISKPYGQSDFQKYIPPFASGDDTPIPIRETGGYIILAENLKNPYTPAFEVPCWHPEDGTKAMCDEVDIYDNGYQKAKFIVAKDDFCVPSDNGRLACAIEETIPLSFGCAECHSLFVNRNGDSMSRFEVVDILYWAHATPDETLMVLQPAEGTSLEAINGMFNKGDEIGIEYVDWGLPAEQNNALAFVYGKDAESSNTEWFEQGGSSIRFGRAQNKAYESGDKTVLRTIVPATTKPGNSYVKRHYMLTGPYVDVNIRADEWADQVYQENLDQSSYASLGRTITLYSIDNKSFGAVGGNDNCSQGTSRCGGYSVPKVNRQAMWSIKCGDQHYVGVDKYHFAPSRDSPDDPLRTYVCSNDPTARPRYTLLGFFEDTCGFLSAAAFDETFC